MKTIAVFDFDGTITRKDTLVEFIKFSKGIRPFYIGLLHCFFYLVAFKLKLYPNWKAKQRLFSYFFKRTSLEEFNRLCEIFFQKKHTQLLYASAIRKIKQYTMEGVEVVIVSASIENWVIPFGRFLGVTHILGTVVECDSDGKLTGHFVGNNCYGVEKVRRLKEIIPKRSDYYIIAYGDSHGDKELLDFADKGYYKYFKL